MSLVVPDASELRLLEAMLKTDAKTLHLFTNDLTPSAANTVTSYVEMSGLGYAAKPLSGEGWTANTLSGEAVGSHAQQTWTFGNGTPIAVYGYYVTDSSGELLWAERFNAAPKTVQYAGDQISITPRLTLRGD